MTAGMAECLSGAAHSVSVMRGGIRWHVEVMGQGPVLLLVHGMGASSHSFAELQPRLARHFTVIAPDLPGHARSRPPPWFEPSLPSMAAALDELLVKLDVKPSVVVGHSAGAAVLARMVLDRSLAPDLLVGLAAALFPVRGLARAVLPRAARLLAVAATFGALGVPDRARVEGLLRTTGSRLDPRGIEAYHELLARPGHLASVLAMMAHWDLEPLFDELPGLETRVLLVAGGEDQAVPLAQQRTVAARIGRARVAVVRGAGHLVHEEQPEQVAQLILDAVDATKRAPR